MTGRVTLLVASPGGHVDELFEFAPLLLARSAHRVWLTADTPQTRSLLTGEEVVWVPSIGPRQGARAVRALPGAVRILRRVRPQLIVSTGASLSLPYLVSGRSMGVETHYIESATRLDGPSLTGRMVSRLPGAVLHHQGFAVPRPRWHPIGSVFDAFESRPGTPRPVHRVVVSVGTERFEFPRALAAVARQLPRDADVLWQTGHTRLDHDLTGTVRQWVPGEELRHAVERADLVITHAGVGSVLTALRAGHVPVVIPRRSGLDEHVDDHQVQLASLLAERGLVAAVGQEQDLPAAIEQTRGRTVVRATARDARFDLQRP